MNSQKPRGFWRDAFGFRGSITPHVLPHVLAFGLIAALLCAVDTVVESLLEVRITLEVAPYEIAGAALSLLLVLRTNAGYDRWWEARKLWGGIVNQSRNLAVTALANGPDNEGWRERIVRWAAVFPHVARASLRGEPLPPEVTDLLGPETAARIAAADHAPSFVSLALAQVLREGCELGMDRFAFLQADRERALLLDHLGGCERILKTPLPRVYAIKIRRFIALFLVMLPLALLHRVDGIWLVPILTMLVAYPLVSLDQIGVELQNPFATRNLSHLPLDDIAGTIERNVRGVLRDGPTVVAVVPVDACDGRAGG